MVVAIPSAEETATADAAPAAQLSHALPHASVNGFGSALENGSSMSEMLPNGNASELELDADTEQAARHSEAVLILGLRGQRHDLERYVMHADLLQLHALHCAVTVIATAVLHHGVTPARQTQTQPHTFQGAAC